MKGIVDPWRVVSPLRPKEPEKKKPMHKIDPSEIDFDADLRPEERCVFASPHGSVLVLGRDITSTDIGLATLVQCLNDIHKQSEEGRALLDASGIRFSFDREPQPWGGLQTTSDDPCASLYFIDQTHTEGMLRLIKVINAVQRRSGPKGADILQRWGVSATMR